MKKLRLRQEVKDVFGVILLYVIVIIGVILLNAQLGYFG